MTDCVHCGNRDYLCQSCKMEELEDYHGTPDDQAARRNALPEVNWWVQDINEEWHAAMYSEDGRHVAACGTILETPVAGLTEDPRHRDDPETCDDCEAALEEDDAAEIEAEFATARELATDGGTDNVSSGDGRETVYVSDAPRRFLGNLLIDGPDGQCAYMYAGIAERCPNDAVAHTYMDHGGEDVRVEMCAEHTREEVSSPPEAEQQELVTDGGEDVDRFTDLPTPDRFFLQLSSAEIDYRVEDWERDEIRFSGQNVPGGRFGFEIAASYTYAGYDCKQHFTLDVEGAVALRKALGDALESKGYDPETGEREILPDGGYRDVDEMSIEELREEFQEVADEVDFREPYEGQADVWDRHEELWNALEERSNVEQPECPECGHRGWGQSPGDPVVCLECSHMASRSLEESVHESWDRIVTGDDQEIATDGGRNHDRAEIDPLQMIVAMILVAIAFYAFLVFYGVTAL